MNGSLMLTNKFTYENGGPNDVRQYIYYAVADSDTKLTVEVDINYYLEGSRIGPNLFITDRPVEEMRERQTYNFSFSPDGKTLTLTGGKNIGRWRVAGPGWSTNRLTKKQIPEYAY